MSLDISLPNATNAREIFTSPVQNLNTTFNTPIVNTNLSSSIPLPSSITSVQQKAAPIMSALDKLNQPVNTLQNMGSMASDYLKKAVNDIVPISAMQNSLQNGIMDKINSMTNLSANIGGITANLNLGGGLIDKAKGLVSGVPDVTNMIGGMAGSALLGGASAIGNSALGLAGAGMGMCGKLSNLLKSAINGLISTALQLQRSILGKLDSLAKEIMKVIDKGLKALLSFIPKVNLKLPNFNIKLKIPDALKSLLSEISKIIPIINNVLKDIADCLSLLTGAMGLLGMMDAVFGALKGLAGLGSSSGGGGSGSSSSGGGGSSISGGSSSNTSNSITNDEKFSDGLSYKDALVEADNLGNIGNVRDYLENEYPGEFNKTIYQQTETNENATNMEIDMLIDDINKEINRSNQEMDNLCLEEVLNPEIKDNLDRLYEEGKENLEQLAEEIRQLIEELMKEYEKCIEEKGESTECNNILKLIEELQELLKEIEDFIKIIEDMHENLLEDMEKIISENLERMKQALEEIRKESEEIIKEHRENVKQIYDEIKKEAIKIDQTAPKINEEYDTSCR